MYLIFLILKSLNYRGKNPGHKHEEQETLQQNFLDDFSNIDFGNSYGSRTYNELTEVVKELENSVSFTNLGQIVKDDEINTIFNKYPIKFD